METIKNKCNHMPLRSYLVFCVIVTLCIVVVCSGLTIWVCSAFRSYLLPKSNMVYLKLDSDYEDGTNVSSAYLLEMGDEAQELPELVIGDEAQELPVRTKYTIEKIENSYQILTPKRKLVYHLCGAVMVLVPVLLSITGILVCGFHFYKKKLARPLELMSAATRQIADQNLDFTIEYPCNDEMGQLCQSFEHMRQALYENNKVMWNMLEERRLLQASIAHDLRNPIAIIEGYTEYLHLNLLKNQLSQEKIAKTVTSLDMAAKRLEQYTESVRTLNQFEDMEIDCQETMTGELICRMEADFRILAQNSGVLLQVENHIPNQTVMLDRAILYRILENLFNNAARFARETVYIDFEMEQRMLVVTVMDDGDGFSEEVLKRAGKLFLTGQSEDGHLGVGLAISRMLCKKHGGSLRLYNNQEKKATVKVKLMC